MFVFGSDGADTLAGSQGYDRIMAGGGNDFIRSYAPADPMLGQTDARMAVADGADAIAAGSGNDTIYSGGGNDTVYGDYGNDYINAGTGNDVISGGLGNDTFAFGAIMTSPGSFMYSGLDRVTDFTQGDDVIDLRGYSTSYYGNPAVTFIGNNEVIHSDHAMVGFHYDGNNTVIDVMAGSSYNTSHEPSAQIVLNGHIDLHATDFIFA
jgi:Ca2+-binding RTX toxin-like protein